MATKKTAARRAKPETEASEGGGGRALWTGSISFGLLQIPVELHGATKNDDVHFHQLDRRDGNLVGYTRTNKVTGKEVEWSDIVKGYEYEKGKYVEVTEEDFQAANVKATQTIDLRDFVDANAVHPAYWETPYYLAPTKKSAKAYAVLREALRRSGKAAIASFVLRTREHLAAVFAYEDVLMLEVLRFSYEIRSPKTLDLPTDLSSLRVSDRELDMAERLVKEMSSPWKPAQYKDTYRDELLARIEEKARKGKVSEPKGAKKSAAASASVVDLMTLLQKSVAQVGRGKAANDGPEAEKPAKARRKTKRTARTKAA